MICLKFNLKRKVKLPKIPGHFLVGDRISNILYSRLRNNCSALKYDLFRCNIIKYSRCVWIYQGERFPLSLELPLIYRAEDSSLSIFTPP